MRPYHRSTPACLVVAIALATGAASRGYAAALEEIVVTAEKKEASIQKTPISLLALTSADLESKGIGGLADMGSQVPNLQLTAFPNSATTVRVFIRGIGNNDDQVTQDPSVAVYLDGVYMARSQGLAMDVADIERIEVLRGPQGSLYGRNATGGAINFITKTPELGAFAFQQDIKAGSRGLLQSRSQITVPVTDAAALQLTYLSVKKDGFIRNAGTGVSRYGDQDRRAYRAAFNWQPTDTFSLRYSYDHSRIEDTPSFTVPVPLPPAHGKIPSYGPASTRNLRPNDVVAAGHNLTIDWEISDTLALKSITGYRTLDSMSRQSFYASLAAPAPLVANYFAFPQDQFTEELQILGNAIDGRLDYVAGAFYLSESVDMDSYTAITGLPRTDNVVSADNRAYALYGQATYTPLVFDEKLHITVGARQSLDQRKATLQKTSVPASGAPSAGPTAKGDRDFNNFSPSLTVAYDINDDVNVYAKAVTGYKTGGYNTRASSIQRFSEGFDAENLVSYEVGVKSQWLENRLRFNAAVFRADYNDIQVGVPDPVTPSIVDVINAGTAKVEGVELELSAAITDGLTASLDYAYLDAKYTEIKNAAGADITSNYTFAEAPHNSYTARLQYDFPRLPFGALSANVDYSWQDDKYTSPNDARYYIEAYGVLNARLSLAEIPAFGGAATVALWGRNLENKEYYTAFINVGVPAATFGEPRSYGVDLSYRY
jgi:iron complex outermembrane receptor protein